LIFVSDSNVTEISAILEDQTSIWRRKSTQDLLGEFGSLLHLVFTAEKLVLQSLVLGPNLAILITPLVLCGIRSPSGRIVGLTTFSRGRGTLILGRSIVRVVVKLLRLGPMGILHALSLFSFGQEVVDLVRDVGENAVVRVDRHLGL